jgi:ADP-dependent NAD(P)H-hydrate dehydratase / NAD(P)H-hydrate epimerase
MPLPAPLLRIDPRSSKKDFGHLLIIAGSPSMLGAAALSSLAAMRSGAGLVTAAIPSGSNLTLQKKVSNVVMTMPLAQNKTGAFSLKAYDQLKKLWDQFDAVAIGPGIGRDPGTQQLARQVIIHCPKPLVIDADALFALALNPRILLKAKSVRVLTRHSGEMSRLTNKSVREIEASRSKIACDFAQHHNCVLLLKGPRTVVASPNGKTYINRTGNVGMATAGSGDVLTGMITVFLGQGNLPYNAACWGAYLHGAAGDRVAQVKFKRGMIAADIIEYIPYVIKSSLLKRTSRQD